MIDILMSTFNGEAFLRPQLDSILSQSHRDFRLLIRDDGSTDATPDIVREYAAIDPRIVIVDEIAGNLRAFASFMKLVEPEGFSSSRKREMGLKRCLPPPQLLLS